MSPANRAIAASVVFVSMLLVVVACRCAKREGTAPNGGSPGDPFRNVDSPSDPRPLPEKALARLGSQRGKDLAGRVEAMAVCYSQDGKVIATADWTGAANMKGYQLWNAESGELIAEVPTPIRALFGVSLSPDGKRFAWSGNDGDSALGVSEVSGGAVLWRGKGGHNVAFTADGRHLVAGGYGGQPAVYDAATGTVVRTLSEPGRHSYDLVVSQNGTTAAVWSEVIPTRNNVDRDTRVEVWDVGTGKLRKVVGKPHEPFHGGQPLAVSSEGRTVAFTSGKRLICAEGHTGNERWRIENPGGNHVWNWIAISPANDVLLGIRTNYDDYPRTTPDLLDLKTGSVLRSLQGEAYQFCRATFSPDGRRILTFGEGFPIRMWETATGRLLPQYDGHRIGVARLAASADGAMLVSADSRYNVCSWDVPGRSLRQRFDIQYARSLDLSADGRFALVTREVTTHLFDLTTNARLPWNCFRSYFSAISPDGRRAAVNRFGGEIEGIDLASGDVRHTLPKHDGDVYAMAFSADGSRLLSAARTPRDRPVPLGRRDHAPPPPDDTVRAWDMLNGKLVRKWELLATSAALSGDGRVLIAGCEDGKVRRMEVDSGRELEVLTFHSAPVGVLAVSANGKLAASADSGGIVVWSIATGREQKRFVPDHGATSALAFSGEARLFSAGSDGSILLWSVADSPFP